MAQSVRIISLWFLLTVSAFSQFGMPFGMVHAVESDTNTTYQKWPSDSLTIWQDATILGSAPKADGDTVGLWTNRGDAGVSFIATTTAPAFYANQINGKPAVRISAGKYLATATSPAARVFVNDTTVHIFIVHNMTSAMPTGGHIFGCQVNNYQFVVGYNSSSPTVEYFKLIGGSTATEYGRVYAAYPTLGSYVVYEASKSGNYPYGAYVLIRHNDSTRTVAYSGLNPVPITLATGAALNIGRAVTTSMAGNIAEIMVFKAPLNATRRATVVAYLKAKYATIP
jgi:hypothetical protein